MEAALKKIVTDPIKIVGIPGSLRKASFNTAILRYIKSNLDANENIKFEIANVDIPLFNQDLESDDGKKEPKSVIELKKLLKDADAFIFSTAEYNYSVSGVIKNAIDWCSRGYLGSAFPNKTATIIGAGGGFGTGRAQYHLRQICVFLDLHLINKPECFLKAFEQDSNGKFKNFNFANGDVIDSEYQKRLIKQTVALKEFTVKKKLGELAFDSIKKAAATDESKNDE